ncbi:hypothetical protein RINTU1_28030 [Candidatus Regiella insecticola]|uniref:Uncharacterized protein n=1 Tax=Candidatus Regiella insecticola TaxID=138073 RepID=A0A6L2ZRF7_9ENTR|nr:hypothetical protein RINTU1_28030 [Candidatus Regiella insecticola]
MRARWANADLKHVENANHINSLEIVMIKKCTGYYRLLMANC